MAHQEFRLNPRLSGDPHLRLDVILAFRCDDRVHSNSRPDYRIHTNGGSNRHYGVLLGSEWEFRVVSTVRKIKPCTIEGCRTARQYEIKIEVYPTLHTWNILTTIIGLAFGESESHKRVSKRKRTFTAKTRCICCD